MWIEIFLYGLFKDIFFNIIKGCFKLRNKSPNMFIKNELSDTNDTIFYFQKYICYINIKNILLSSKYDVFLKSTFLHQSFTMV